MITKLLLIAIIAVAITPTQNIIYPDDNPDCVTPWRLLFYFEHSIHCGGGEYYIFVCQPEIGTPGSIFQEFCTSSISSWHSNNIFLPVIKR